jgi:hypothetical protein
MSEKQKTIKIRYVATPTARRFHGSNAFVRGIKGPIGSGKSVMCVWELFTRAKEQVAYNGIRKSRWAIIRRTYPELRDTTMRTFLDWVPEGNFEGYSMKVNRQPPMTAVLTMALPDNTTVFTEFIFLALDQEDDVSKLKSLELTGGWINEASEIDNAIFRMLRGRVRRYPSKREGGYAWSGVIMDTNPPDDESWWYQYAEIEKPTNWEFFAQPPSIIPVPKKRPDEPQLYMPNHGQGAWPAAENAENHNEGFNYWLDLTAGADEEWVKVFLMGQYGSVIDGKPVYGEYKDDIHCAKEDLTVMNGLPIILGWDFGMTPAVTISQLSMKGQFRIVDELVSGLMKADLKKLPAGRYFHDMGIREFATNYVKPYLMNTYPGVKIISVGDPAGTSRAQSDETTCMQELADAGIPTEQAPTNNFMARREAVAGFLNRMIDGGPGFIMSPRCRMLRRGFQGRYMYKQFRLQTGTRYASEPEKNKFSHPHDSLQYAAMRASGSQSQPSHLQSGRPPAKPVTRLPSRSKGYT